MQSPTLAQLLSDLLKIDPARVNRYEFRKVLGFIATPIGTLSPDEQALVRALQRAKYAPLCIECRQRVLIGEERTTESLQEIHRKPRYLTHTKCSGRKSIGTVCNSYGREEDPEGIDLAAYERRESVK